MAVNADDAVLFACQIRQNGVMRRFRRVFRGKQVQDIRVRYIAPVVIAVIVVAVMAGLSGILFWAYHIAPEEAPPLWFLWLIVGMFTAVGVGVILALMQRIREIGKGEIDDAKRY